MIEVGPVERAREEWIGKMTGEKPVGKSGCADNPVKKARRQWHSTMFGDRHVVIRLVRAARERLHRAMYDVGMSSTAGLSLPHFLGIGAMKAGSTWLYENLRCHPDLWLPRPKELHYFDRYLKTGRLVDYAAQFSGGNGKLIGEVTPAYSALPLSRIQYIRRIMPRVKLILLFRNPIERAWSQVFMRLVTKRHRCLEEVSDEEFIVEFNHQGTVKRGEYTKMLSNWLQVFPREQLYIGLYDDIKHRPKELLTDIFRHLGVTTEVDWGRIPYERTIRPGHHKLKTASQLEANQKRPTSAAYMRPSLRAYLEGMYREEIERLSERFGDRIASWRCPVAGNGETSLRASESMMRMP